MPSNFTTWKFDEQKKIFRTKMKYWIWYHKRQTRSAQDKYKSKQLTEKSQILQRYSDLEDNVSASKCLRYVRDASL